jgi:hypothetical protein
VAEPYVPIASYATTNALLTELEVATDGAETNADALDLSVDNTLVHKQTAENALASKFDLFFLVGA